MINKHINQTHLKKTWSNRGDKKLCAHTWACDDHYGLEEELINLVYFFC